LVIKTKVSRSRIKVNFVIIVKFSIGTAASVKADCVWGPHGFMLLNGDLFPSLERPVVVAVY